MSRPKGSKNKIQNPYGKNYAINNSIQPIVNYAILPAIDNEEKQSLVEYNATLNEQDPTLDTFLIETVDNTLASVEIEYMPIKRRTLRQELLNLMSKIHSEIAPILNDNRKALANCDATKHVGYVLDNPNEDYVKLVGV